MKETLEEAAEKIYPNDGFKDEIYDDIGEVFREKFIEGAKWQQEQDKNKYSEEEVLELLQKALTHQDDGETGNLVTLQRQIRTANFYSWFEKFKK